MQLPTAKIFLHRLTQYPIPALNGTQLRRNSLQPGKEPGHPLVGSHDILMAPMTLRNGERLLTRMVRQFADPVQQ